MVYLTISKFEYLIIAVDESDIVGYYLLTDAAMEKADDCNDYWEFVGIGRRQGVKRFRNLPSLIRFIAKHNVKLKGEFGAITY